MPSVAPARRRWFRYSLRTIFVVMTLLAISTAVMTREWRRYEREQEAISRINDLGVSFGFHDRLPALLRRLVGDERLTMFQSVERISFPPDGVHIDAGGGAVGSLLGASDDDLANRRTALEELPSLSVLNLSSTRITDSGLAHLHGLKQLRRLDVRGTPATADGIASLQQRLPQLVIEK